MNEIEIGKDYAFIFWISSPSNGKLIYLGGIKWELTDCHGRVEVRDDQGITDIVMCEINGGRSTSTTGFYGG